MLRCLICNAAHAACGSSEADIQVIGDPIPKRERVPSMLKRYTDANGNTRQLSEEHAIALGFNPKDGVDRPAAFMTPSEKFMAGGKPPQSETSLVSSSIVSTPAKTPRRGRGAKNAEVKTQSETPTVPTDAPPAGTPEVPVPPAEVPDEDDLDDDLEDETTGEGEDDDNDDDETEGEEDVNEDDENQPPQSETSPGADSEPKGSEAANKKRTPASNRARQPRTNS